MFSVYIGSLRILVFCLPPLHFPPADVTVYIVRQKGKKANHHGNIFGIGNTCKNPQNDQHDVIGSICQCKCRTSSEGQICRKKACCNRYCAWHDICRMKPLQDVTENDRDGKREKPHQDLFFFADTADPDLCFIPVIGIFSPGDQRKTRHRHGHAQISKHFAVIRKCIGNHAVYHAENDHQHLPYGISFRIEYQRRHPDQGSYQSQAALPVKNQERHDDNENVVSYRA